MGQPFIWGRGIDRHEMAELAAVAGGTPVFKNEKSASKSRLSRIVKLEEE